MKNLQKKANEDFIVAQNDTPIEQLEAFMFNHDETSEYLNYFHHWFHGYYVRELQAKAGCFVLGLEHKTDHLFFLQEGTLRITDGESSIDIKGPFLCNAGPGRKFVYTLTDCVIINLINTKETDLKKIEDDVTVKTDTCKKHRRYTWLLE